MSNQTVAFIGLGNMGGPMASNLINAGFNVVCFDLQTSLTQPLVDEGATAAATAIDAVAGANFVISMLPSVPKIHAPWQALPPQKTFAQSMHQYLAA
jgi:3-hydroxyisobutyrate dehydrogenase-like beta-hydroxyacid dehydrogenase